MSAEILGALSKLYEHARQPAVIAVGPVNHAMLIAFETFKHRDRRRIKREVNKAVRMAKRRSRA